MLIDMLILKR
ncbi:hypothetical protein YPPY59_1815, partial [Yersinia pestis PY-59]